MGNIPWESMDVIPGGHAGWRQHLLSKPNVVLLNPDVFSPPMLRAIGAVPLSSTYEPPSKVEEYVSMQQQPNGGEQ